MIVLLCANSTQSPRSSGNERMNMRMRNKELFNTGQVKENNNVSCIVGKKLSMKCYHQKLLLQ